MKEYIWNIYLDLRQVVNDPNTASARVVMEVVRQLFTKLVQATRYAEPAARYCITVIEVHSIISLEDNGRWYYLCFILCFLSVLRYTR